MCLLYSFLIRSKTTKNSLYKWLKNLNKLWYRIVATAPPGMAGQYTLYRQIPSFE